MKWVVRIVAVAVALVLIAVVFAAAAVSRETNRILGDAQGKVLADWNRFAPDITADTARWASDPLFAARDGGDAAPVLFAHLRWEGVDGGGTTDVPEPLVDQLRSWGGEFARHAGDAGESDVDVKWLSQLAQYGYWDIEPIGGPLDGHPFEPLSEPLPNFVDLGPLAKVRLMQGLTTGTHVMAGAEVRELARLCFTSENLIGEMVGVMLLNLERQAHQEAVRRGLDVTGWAPVSEEDALKLKRLLWATKGPHSPLATGQLAATEVRVGRCSSLREGMAMAHFGRRFSEGLIPERYAAWTAALAKNDCRLRRLRAAWASKTTEGQLPLDSSAHCEGDSFACRAPQLAPDVPFVRSYVGASLLAAGDPGWFKYYDESR